jgi:hypothetical protein
VARFVLDARDGPRRSSEESRMASKRRSSYVEQFPHEMYI